MRKLIIIALISLGLTGCVRHAQYGNFIKNPLEINQDKIAVDSVNQLSTVYPPAKTQFVFTQNTTDNFGISFLNGLRKKGYSVREVKTDNKSIQNSVTKNSANSPEIPVSYIFDQFQGENFYRITIVIGEKSISRLYTKNNSSVIPAGYWVMKE